MSGGGGVLLVIKATPRGGVTGGKPPSKANAHTQIPPIIEIEKKTKCTMFSHVHLLSTVMIFIIANNPIGT